MSVTFGFYNSLAGDRRYNAEQLSAIFDGIIKDGVFMSIGDALVVRSAGAGMDIIVGAGKAWFNHTWTNNDSDLVLMIDPSDLILNRIDAVVLEVDSSDPVRANTIKVLKGIPATNPVQPILTDTDFVHQYPLCYISIAAGVSEIVAANITNTIGTAACPFVTGILDSVNIDALLAQWNAEFNTWFEGLQEILDENTAGNLLGLITDVSNALGVHSADDTKHVTKDGVLQEGLNAQIVNGVYLRNNNGSVEWSTDNANWNSMGGSNGFEFGLPPF